jgi:hypothetical protein
MPIYATPGPIDLAINLPVGAIEIVASDRADTVVTVQPTNPDKAVDRRGAEETRVDFEGSSLTIRGPKPRFTIIGPSESIDVRVELPTGSRLAAEISVGGVRTTGRLGATRIKAMTGGIAVDHTGDLWIRAGHGTATVGSVHGSLEITADHGQIRVGTVTGDSMLKASHGNIRIDDAGGDVEAKLSYGDLEIGRARASVAAKTAYGALALGEVSAGAIQLESGFGEVSIGVRDGIPAWLDLSSKEGRVRNELVGDSAPAGDEDTVAVRARTQFGNISVTRATTTRREPSL